VPAPWRISLSSFTANFQRFKELIAIAEGHPLQTFTRDCLRFGRDNKPRLRNYALDLLAFEDWKEKELGRAEFSTDYSAIEIQSTRKI